MRDKWSKNGPKNDVEVAVHRTAHPREDAPGLVLGLDPPSARGVRSGEAFRPAKGLEPCRNLGRDDLKTENGRKNVKSAPYRPILSEDRRRQRPTHVYSHANPAQYGQNGENWPGKCRGRQVVRLDVLEVPAGLQRRPAAPNWAQHRIASTNQHEVRLGTK